MNILTEIGYVEEFNDKVRFSFDSDENVQKKISRELWFKTT